MQNVFDEKRAVIPRWRALARTADSELQSSQRIADKDRTLPSQARLEELYERWRSSPSLETALEVIDIAAGDPRPFLAIGPAKMILNDPNSMPAAKVIARAIVGENEANPAEQFIQIDYPITDERTRREVVGRKIRELKVILNDQPRNALMWAEKARLHTIIGDVKNAELAFRRGLGCAPENRFILRSFSRFMVHLDRADEAHKRLLRSPSLKHDPWIQAAEIALSETSGRSAVSVSQARLLLSQNKLNPVHLSELAAALATLEANNGRERLAKRLFRQSLIRPTDNSLAQALWARQQLKIYIDIEPVFLTMKDAFEARLHSAISKSRWREAAQQCVLWLEDEPFSRRAAGTGSFLAVSYLWDSELALRFCELGLIANPDDWTLINNKVVALLHGSRIGEARHLIERVESVATTGERHPVAMATMGLYAFRSGDPVAGRAWYSRSVERATETKSLDDQLRARAHWLYEEWLAGTLPEESVKLASQHLDAADKIPGVSKSSWEAWKIIQKRMHSPDGGKTKFGTVIEIPRLLLGDNAAEMF